MKETSAEFKYNGRQNDKLLTELPKSVKRNEETRQAVMKAAAQKGKETKKPKMTLPPERVEAAERRASKEVERARKGPGRALDS